MSAYQWGYSDAERAVVAALSEKMDLPAFPPEGWGIPVSCKMWEKPAGVDPQDLKPGDRIHLKHAGGWSNVVVERVELSPVKIICDRCTVRVDPEPWVWWRPASDGDKSLTETLKAPPQLLPSSEDDLRRSARGDPDEDHADCPACDGEGVSAEVLESHAEECDPDFRTIFEDAVVRCLSCSAELSVCEACADYSLGRKRP